MTPSPPVFPLASGQAPGAAAHGGPTVYLDSSPYPEVTGANDPDTVAMLKEDYAGAASELTAIAQYVFQNIQTDSDAFANAMLQVAIVEMSHLDMLGDAIETLGGNPMFTDGRHFWQAGNVNYATELRGMLLANIDAENGAIASYEDHAGRTGNSSVRDLLLRIVKDERLHLRFFTEMLARVPANSR